MLQDMVNSQDHQIQQQLDPIDEITSPLGSAQLFEFCESKLFNETLQNPEVTSTSNNNCCYEDQNSYQINMNNYTTTTTDNDQINPPAPPITATNPSTPTAGEQNTNFSISFDDPADDQLENDISASIDFTPSPSFSAPHQYYNNNNNSNNNNTEPFDISSLNNHLSLSDHQYINGQLNQYAPQERWSMVVTPPPVVGPPPLPTSYEDECLASMPSYIRLRPSQPACSLMDNMMPTFLPPGNMNAPFSTENSGMFTGNGGLMLGNDLSNQDLDFQGDSGGLFLPDNLPRIFNCSSELQTLSNESQQLVVHGGTSTTPLTSEISSLDDPTFKVGKLSVEERKRKINRYMKKRNERNFSKKIKYACRKTLADSRPRVRGRFAKNDELARTTSSNHEDVDTDDDVTLFSNSIPDHQRKVAVKEEDDLDSADIFAHISGVNSFKCNYPIQSWI
ncbi:hypothetical protein CASFOL_030028 [Castilleja foliolosa]|uniref:CCT domain-containing protein n=1 Tax=Castilleja foliolosa TaxID=1961234 RepID=A0ABD3CAT5_9LAMI